MATEVVFVIVNEVKMRFVTPHNLPPHNGGHGVTALPFLPVGRASKLPERGILTKNRVSGSPERAFSVKIMVSGVPESLNLTVGRVSQGCDTQPIASQGDATNVKTLCVLCVSARNEFHNTAAPWAGRVAKRVGLMQVTVW